MRLRRHRLRTIHVEILDRQLAEARAISRAIAAGARWADVRSSEQILDPDSGRSVWEVVLAVPRRRK
ncbi:MAG: hypothetical protein M3N53_13345 [Actinomycetota bacterium]|nr:hypothetical protein [Actinomycetota bacterium]